MDRKTKEKVRETVTATLKDLNAVIIAEYRGLTVKEVTDLRTELRKVNAEFKIVKNRIIKKAIENDVPELECLNTSLKGPIGLVCAYGDPAQAAKTAVDFQKISKNFCVTSGYLEKTFVNSKQIVNIAGLPTKDELLAKILGSIVAPHKGIVTVLSGVTRQLVQVINQIKEKKLA